MTRKVRRKIGEGDSTEPQQCYKSHRVSVIGLRKSLETFMRGVSAKCGCKSWFSGVKD